MADETKAGALLLSQIGMFNEAKIHWENVVEPEILGAIDAIVENYAEGSGWDGKFDINDDNCWIAPPSWKVADQKKKSIYKAKISLSFDNDNEDDSEDYWTARFCKQGKEGNRAGFYFEVNSSEFSGKNPWKAYAQKIDSDFVKELTAMKFEDASDGAFFLPIELDSGLLAKAWETYGADSDNLAEDDCFKPVIAALESIEKSIPIFDKIMDRFVKK